MVGLYHDPKGKKIFQAAACSSVNVIANSASTNEENTVSTMADLAKRIQELEVQIAHYSRYYYRYWHSEFCVINVLYKYCMPLIIFFENLMKTMDYSP